MDRDGACANCSDEFTSRHGPIPAHFPAFDGGSAITHSNYNPAYNPESDYYTLNDYQKDAGSTAIYPGGNTPLGITYTILGLVGETGEIANKWKKYYRDAPDHNDTTDTPADPNGDLYVNAYKDQLRAELGDVLWYVANLASELDIDLGELAVQNVKKLKDRKARNKLKGSGDNR